MDFQKKPREVFCKKRCSSKFRKFHKKTPMLESLFNKMRFQHRSFPVKFPKTLGTLVLKNICKRLLLDFKVNKNVLYSHFLSNKANFSVTILEVLNRLYWNFLFMRKLKYRS